MSTSSTNTRLSMFEEMQELQNQEFAKVIGNDVLLQIKDTLVHMGYQHRLVNHDDVKRALKHLQLEVYYEYVDYILAKLDFESEANQLLALLEEQRTELKQRYGNLWLLCCLKDGQLCVVLASKSQAAVEMMAQYICAIEVHMAFNPTV